MSKRSIKIGGVTTSLFLEDAFWQEIEIRAEEKGSTASQYLRQLLGNFDTGSNRSAAIKELLMSSLREEFNKQGKDLDNGPKSRWLVESLGTRNRHEFFKETISIGADSANDIELRDPEVEARHAILAYDGKRWWAVDLNSKSGIKLNNKDGKVVAVPRRSELLIGNTQVIKV